MSEVGEIGWVWGLDKILLPSGKSTFSGFIAHAGLSAGCIFASHPSAQNAEEWGTLVLCVI
jgi:hypothetical protein